MRQNRGFTLVEMLVTIVIFLVLLAAANTALWVGQRSLYTSNASVDAQQEFRKFRENMVKELTQAGGMGIAIDMAGEQIDFSIPTDVDAIGSITWTDLTYRYLPDTRQIEREDATGAKKIIANNVSYFYVEEDGTEPRLINIEITTQTTDIAGRIVSYPSTLEVRYRN